jgi:hypothetical protein
MIEESGNSVVRYPNALRAGLAWLKSQLASSVIDEHYEGAIGPPGAYFLENSRAAGSAVAQPELQDVLGIVCSEKASRIGHMCFQSVS